MMTTNELRKAYLDFFAKKNHQVFSSDSLVPKDDPSLLFTGAGMNQFKPYFLGLKKDVARATSCQKCLRTADLDRVGKTAYHHTFFEMLGNFSFGNYFKEEAIAWGWEFVTKTLGLPKEKLWVSVYEEDDEAFAIWKNKIGVAESRIVRMDAVDNFWPSNAKLDGPNGPCGPCSEIYVGEVPGKGVEIWNLVFTAFNRQSDGTLIDLPQRNIDTGMGLERTAAVLQGVESNFDTDNFQIIRSELKKLLDKSKEPTDPKVARAHENAVMDHIRAVVFSITDGALPSNEGRGYVIRKIIRLGTDHLDRAGAKNPGSFHKLVPSIIQVMGSIYPEIVASQKNISAIIENEEKSYLEILRKAETINFKQTNKSAEEFAFSLYDTYGIPIEVVKTKLANEGIVLNQEKFNQYLEEQRDRSRKSSKIAGEIFGKTALYELISGLNPTQFLGYESTNAKAKLIRIIQDEKIVDELKSGQEGILIFDKTPFYAESGGQVGDMGEITSNEFRAQVTDTKNMEKCIAHTVKALNGAIKVGADCNLIVDGERRLDIMRNHTATHLLHSALRKLLGEHVKQSGSLVASDYLRFDFTHFSALKPEQLLELELMVNDQVSKNITLDKKILSKEAAVKEGAIAFFGEKYGSEVRVVTIGGFSKELCGGTHLETTAQIGKFKIISEGSIQAGVRRIEAVTGRTAEVLRQKEAKELALLANEFKVDENELYLALKIKNASLNTLNQRLSNALSSKIRNKVMRSFENAQVFSGVKFLKEHISGVDIQVFQPAVEHLKSLNTPFVAFFISDFSDKVSFAVGAGNAMVQKGFHSGKIVKEISLAAEGNGGGRPEFAIGGGKNIQKLSQAVSLGEKIIKEAIT